MQSTYFSETISNRAPPNIGPWEPHPRVPSRIRSCARARTTFGARHPIPRRPPRPLHCDRRPLAHQIALARPHRELRPVSVRHRWRPARRPNLLRHQRLSHHDSAASRIRPNRLSFLQALLRSPRPAHLPAVLRLLRGPRHPMVHRSNPGTLAHLSRLSHLYLHLSPQPAWLVCRAHRRFLNAWTAAVLLATGFLLVPYLSAKLTSGIAATLVVAFGNTLTALSIGGILIYVIDNPQSTAGRFLNLRLICHLGVISYSLYLWQQIFTGNPTRMHLSVYLLILAAAELSFWLIEKPAMRLRTRLNL